MARHDCTVWQLATWKDHMDNLSLHLPAGSSNILALQDPSQRPFLLLLCPKAPVQDLQAAVVFVSSRHARLLPAPYLCRQCLPGIADAASPKKYEAL